MPHRLSLQAFLHYPYLLPLLPWAFKDGTPGPGTDPPFGAPWSLAAFQRALARIATRPCLPTLVRGPSWPSYEPRDASPTATPKALAPRHAVGHRPTRNNDGWHWNQQQPTPRVALGPWLALALATLRSYLAPLGPLVYTWPCPPLCLIKSPLSRSIRSTGTDFRHPPDAMASSSGQQPRPQQPLAPTAKAPPKHFTPAIKAMPRPPSSAASDSSAATVRRNARPNMETLQAELRQLDEQYPAPAPDQGG